MADSGVHRDLYDRYKELRTKVGLTATQAADQLQVSPTTMARYEKILRHPLGSPAFPIQPDRSDILADFGRFRRRYFNRSTVPWQEDAARRIEALLKRPEKVYVVINAPPGSGKSTLFTHDIPAWLAVRNTRIRCLVGSRTERQAAQYTGRLRRSFGNERSSFVSELGPFRPLQRDLWRNSEFIIAAGEEESVDEKEPTFAAYGQDSGFLGGRYDFVIWDDLVDNRNARTVEQREALVHWFETEAITRLEPSGLFVLQGQRIGPDDLYRYALDLLDGNEEEERPLFEHVVYRSHYEDRCRGLHGVDDPPWPQGCLLDPVRLPWKELRAKQRNHLERYLVLYQQEDIDPSASLVHPMWLEGGVDKNGAMFPGCFDDYSLWELPRGVDLSECVLVATVDPSATRYWCAQLWLYHQESERRFLIGFYRDPLDAPGFLDYVDGEFRGLMQDWQVWAYNHGLRIQTWVVEANATQRFLLQYTHVQRWIAQWGVTIVPHQTTMRKNDTELGVQSIASYFKFGRIRLPGYSRAEVKPFTDELIRWPNGRTDDCVMACWFYFLHEPSIVPPKVAPPRFSRPSWINQSRRGLNVNG